MYASIRRYTPKTSASNQDIEGLRRRIEENFLPVVQDIRGFHSYGVVNVGNRELLSINIFATSVTHTSLWRSATEA